MFEKKEIARDGFVCIYECGKQLLHSTYERAWASKDMTTINIKEMLK